MEKDLITIVIPVYKVEKYIDRCIQSVLNQTYKNIEIILVDDGSPDNCGRKCDEYAKKDKRIKVIHKVNGGLSDARNIGIECAKGKYISFIDSDDWVTKDYIECLYTTLIKENVLISIGDVMVEYDSGLKIDYSNGKEYILSTEEEFEKMLYGIRDLDNGAWCKLYAIKLFDKVRYPIGKYYEDTATTYKIIDKVEKVAIISKPIYHYMKRSDSITEGKFNMKKMELIEATQNMTEYIKKKYPSLTLACDRKIVWSYLSTLSQISYCSKPNKEIAESLRKKALEKKKNILWNKKTSTKDKIGILCLMFGFNFYRCVWNFYSKKSGRRFS